MPVCHDQSSSYLQEQLGFNLISFPRASISPLIVLFRNPGSESVSAQGPISDFVLEAKEPLPVIKENSPASTISGLKTDKFQFGIGIHFLKLLLSAIGAKAMGVEAIYKNASFVEFEYENVQQDFVFPSSVGKFLRHATPDTEWLFENFDQPNEAYILTDVIKSNSFSTRAYRENGAGVDVDFDAVKALLDANSDLSIEKKEDIKLTYKGSQALGFGFKACPFWAEIVNGKAKFSMNPSTASVLPDIRGAVTDSSLAVDDEEVEPDHVLIAPDRLLKFR